MFLASNIPPVLPGTAVPPITDGPAPTGILGCGMQWSGSDSKSGYIETTHPYSRSSKMAHT